MSSNEIAKGRMPRQTTGWEVQTPGKFPDQQKIQTRLKCWLQLQQRNKRIEWTLATGDPCWTSPFMTFMYSQSYSHPAYHGNQNKKTVLGMRFLIPATARCCCLLRGSGSAGSALLCSAAAADNAMAEVMIALSFCTTNGFLQSGLRRKGEKKWAEKALKLWGSKSA